MSRACRLTCVFLSVVILFSAAFGSTLWVTAENVAYYLDASNVNIREDATTNSKSLGKLSNVWLTKNGEKQGVDDNYVWFNVTYGDITGYIRSDFIKELTVQTDASFEEQLAAFPESYRDYLRQLHNEYPNWNFHADNINLTLDEAVEHELIRKVTDYKYLSWRSMDFGSYDWGTGEWASTDREDRWHYVSREVIKYYMDPRNFLNTSYIYTFLQQDYNANLQNEEGLRKIISGTFLERGYDGVKDAYINDIMAAAQSSGVNPYILASTIIQEQGSNGNTDLISGVYPEYEGHYNFFNVGAYDNNSTVGGLAYAQSKGWNSRSAAIIGGAEFCGNKYLKSGQNTYFYMNYNIKDIANIWRQYATAVHDSASKGKNVSKTYKDLKTAELDFLIPVYKDMPSAVSPLPDKNDNLNNYYFDSISVAGLTDTFDRFKYSYVLNVSGDTTVSVSVPKEAAYVGAASYRLNAGDNTVRLTVKSQTGYTRDYVIEVKADIECTLYIDSGGNPIEPEVMCGDTNGDGKINGRDAANVQMHILEIKLLSGNAFKGGDTNGDGVINGRDAANIQMHILDIKYLT